MQDLAARPGVLKIHTLQRCVSVAESLKQHADRRIDRYYPLQFHDSRSGALLPGLAELMKSQKSAAESPSTPSRNNESLADSVFNMKQSIMHDSAPSVDQLFQHARPTIVTDEGESVDTYAPEVALQQGMDNIVNMDVRMNNEFEDQYVTKYLPRIFQWTLNYGCGEQSFQLYSRTGKKFLQIRILFCSVAFSRDCEKLQANQRS